jgi:capsular polysaccharide transport system permease protein
MLFHYFLFVALKKPMPARIPVELFIIGSFTIWFAAVHVLRSTGHTGRDGRGIPGVTGLHLAIARGVWEFLSMLSYAIACVLLLTLLGFREPLPNVLATTAYFMLAVLMGFGLGLILLASGRMFAATEALKKNLYWILYVTSGHYFSISQGRHGLADLVWWNPILHLSELQRRALYPGYPIELVTYWYPATMAAALIVIGLLLEKCTRNRQDRSA